MKLINKLILLNNIRNNKKNKKQKNKIKVNKS